MLDTLNGLGETAWAGLAALVTIVVTGIGAAWRGTKKEPPDVGQPLPPADQTSYLLAELRLLNRKHDEGTKVVDARFDESERLLLRIHQDTQVIRDRGSR